MSGGSYNYLAFQDASDLLSGSRDSELEQMADRLAGLGNAEDAAKATHEVLLLVRQARIRLQTRIERLSGVWKAVEWADSYDCGPEAIDEALTKYRADLQEQN